MDPNKYFRGYNLKNAERKQKFGYAKNVQFGWKIFTLNPVANITVYFKKLVSDLYHAGFALVERESIKRKRGPSEKPQNITITSETFPCAIEKHLVMHQSDFTLQIPS